MSNPRAHLDAETGSPLSLSDAGVHKYAEHPLTRAHMFTWCIEDASTENYTDPANGQVKQRPSYRILARGRWRPGQPDPIPLLDHIAAGRPIVAHNAEFDRTIYNKLLRARVVSHWPEWTIAQSDCTMARAAVLGIPEKLDFVAPVLGMELRKDPEGEKIMRLLSKPQTVRCVACKGKGTGELGYCLLCGGDGSFSQWFDTSENLDKLGTLRCDLDVEMETQVDHLCPFLTATERRAWEHNQIMNERGLKLDTASVQRAIAIVEYGKQRLNARLSEITGGAVKSGTKLADILLWINEQGVSCDSIRKGEQEDIILRAKNTASKEIADAIQEIIEIRRAVSKPTSKFQRALQIVCADGRMHGLTHYYGAHCLPGDAEVLTRDGWVEFQHWEGGEIAQVESGSAKITFQSAERYVGPTIDHWIRVDAPYLRCDFTPGHRLPYRLDSKYRRWSVLAAADLLYAGKREIPNAGTLDETGDITPLQMRILVMVQADGNWSVREGRKTALRLKFKKQRKIDRARWLLSAADLSYTERVQGSGATVFRVSSIGCPEWLTPNRKVFGPWLLNSNLDARLAFVDEVRYWDGWKIDEHVKYCTSVQQNADWVATIAHLTGHSASAPSSDPTGMFGISIKPRAHTAIFAKHTKLVHCPQRAYCATTKTGYFLVRSEGYIFVSHNTGRDAGRLMQVHNLYRVDEERDGKDIDITFDIFSRDISIEEAYDQIDLVVGDPITAITKCTRRFIIAEEGKRFIGGDYSNVEGCGSAWLSGEQWKIDAYRAQQAEPKNKARDMYRVSYCKSFGGEPGETTDLQRQIGKVQELQLGYQGSVGAFVTMSEKQGFDLERLVPPVKAVTSQEVWDKALWLYSIVPAVQRCGLERELWAPLKIIVMNWRAAHPMTTQAWWDQQDAAIEAVANPGTVTECCGGKIKYMTDRNILWCQLPSTGMRAYVHPHLATKDDSYIILPDGERLGAEEYNDEYTDVEINALLRMPGVEHKKRIRRQVIYEGYIGDKKRWGRHALYGGRQHENNVQGFCRDILRFGVDNLEAGGYPVGLTVYDEALAEVSYGQGSAEEFAELFGRKDDWYADFPLAVKSWEDPRYAK